MSDTKELSVPERAAVALGTAEHEKNLIALSTKYADITAIANSAGREQVHSAYMELKNTRVAIVNAGKKAREDANAFQTAVIAEVARLTAITADEEARLQFLRDEYDLKVAQEKQARAEAERQRVEAIRKRIAEIQAIPAMLVGKQSQTIAAAIESLEAVEITLEAFAEFAGESQMVKIAAAQKLGEMLSAQVAHEEEQKRIQAERAELERLRAEAAERERIAAAERAEAERVARVAREAEESRLRAEREAHEAELRKQREAAEAKLRAEREAAEAALRAQREELARQQAEIDRQRAEAERVERERLAAIEAEKRATREREEAEAAAIARAEAERVEAEQAAEAKRLAALVPVPVEMVSVPKKEYERLLERDDWLSCLEAAGVDNWEGMEEAIRIRREEEVA